MIAVCAVTICTTVLESESTTFQHVGETFNQIMSALFPVSYQFFHKIKDYDLDNNFEMLMIIVFQTTLYVVSIAYFSYKAYMSGLNFKSSTLRALGIISLIYLVNYALSEHVRTLI